MSNISWNEYFMGVALLSAKRSKDPNTKVGCCIVNEDKRIISIGYNGFPSGIDDEILPWERNSDKIYNTKYPYVIHAEANAILNKVGSIKGATCYVTLFPCPDCMKLLVQSKVKEIIYLENKYKGTPEQIAAERLANVCNIVLRKYDENE